MKKLRRIQYTSNEERVRDSLREILEEGCEGRGLFYNEFDNELVYYDGKKSVRFIVEDTDER